MSRIEDSKYIIQVLNSLDNTPVIHQSIFFQKAKKRIQKQIEKNIAYVTYQAIEKKTLKDYIFFQYTLLNIEYRWQNLLKVAIAILTIGKIKK